MGFFTAIKNKINKENYKSNTEEDCKYNAEIKISGESLVESYRNRAGHLYYWISEFIDNSIESFKEIKRNNRENNINYYKDEERKIEIIFDFKSNNESKIIINDNATGLANSLANFKQIFSKIGEINKETSDDKNIDSNHEHNEGLKSALFALGKNIVISWKNITTNEKVAIETKLHENKVWFKQIDQNNNLLISNVDFPINHGTNIIISSLVSNNINQDCLINGKIFNEFRFWLMDKYKKWLSEKGNTYNMKINITIKCFNDNQDIDKKSEDISNLNKICEDNYIFIDNLNEKYFEGNSNYKIPININFYQNKSFIYENLDDNQKYDLIKKFLSLKINGEDYFYTKEYDEIEEEVLKKIKDIFQIKWDTCKYSRYFHNSIKNYFDMYCDDPNGSHAEGLNNIYKVLFKNKKNYFFWIDKIKLENDNVNNSCDCKQITDENHNIVLYTFINPKMKKGNYNVENWHGYNLEHKERLLVFGNNKQPFSKKYLVQKNQLGNFVGSSYNKYPVRITGTIVVPNCFKTDTNKRNIKDEDIINKIFSNDEELSSKFKNIFLKKGYILASYLLMNFIEIDSKNKKQKKNNDNYKETKLKEAAINKAKLYSTTSNSQKFIKLDLSKNIKSSLNNSKEKVVEYNFFNNVEKENIILKIVFKHNYNKFWSPCIMENNIYEVHTSNKIAEKLFNHDAINNNECMTPKNKEKSLVQTGWYICEIFRLLYQAKENHIDDADLIIKHLNEIYE